MFEIFKSYQFNQEKVRAFGFIENEGVWSYSFQILDGDFVMIVSITTDNVSFQVFDQETGDQTPSFSIKPKARTFSWLNW